MDGQGVVALEKIVSKAVFTEIGGQTFGRNERGEIAPVIYSPRPDPVVIHNLSGLVDYIKANVDKLDLAKHLIVVQSPVKVVLYSAISGPDRSRDEVAVVKLDEKLDDYQFGRYQEVEPFVVSLNSLFEETLDREKLVKYVSKVRGGTSFTLEDDGVTQVAEVTKGIAGALTEKETAPKIVKLRPYRSFRDIEQPVGEFLFRLKLIDTEGHIVGACLYEADGGRWRNVAVQSIKEYLAVVGVAIIA